MGQQYLMYKQNGWSRTEPSSDSPPRIDDERKLLDLWRQEEVDEDYQAVVLHFFDSLTSLAELHRQMQAELRRTYQRDSHYFRIDKLMQEREKTMGKLECEVGMLERYKHQRGEPNLEPVCLLIDHIRKVHLLIAEEIHEMFNNYGHPRVTRVGFSYFELFREFDEDLQFLRESLLKFYIPFSSGFDPLLLELSQRLRKCYANQSLVYDRNIEELINLNASYLYRLLRAQQRMVDAISAVDHKADQPMQFVNRMNPYPYKGRNILESIAEEEPKARSTQPTERFQPSRLAREDTKPFSIPRKMQNEQRYQVTPSPRQRKGMIDTGVQRQGPRLEIVKQNIKIFRDRDRAYQDRPHIQSSATQSPKQFPNYRQQEEAKIVRTPRKLNKVQSHLQQEEQQGPKSLHFYRKMQPSPQTISHYKNSHKRTHTDTNTITRKGQQRAPRENLPKLSDSRDRIIGKKQDCLCRQKYKDKNCEHQQEEQLSEAELERRRKIIIKEIQGKYRAMAQREMRHQLSKLGDATYHRLRNQQQSRVGRGTRTIHPS